MTEPAVAFTSWDIDLMVDGKPMRLHEDDVPTEEAVARIGREHRACGLDLEIRLLAEPSIYWYHCHAHNICGLIGEDLADVYRYAVSAVGGTP